ncbi:MAG: leucine-rich repeat domain-containing protein [Oscillospiraceae bacterium]|nr:leucine-rich repeat domain-containing protein [Oscillospiraceae bacterium]
MANSKAPGTTMKKSSLIYPAALVLPALIMVACGIIFRFEAIVPYIVAYALIAAIPGFFLGSKKYGMAAILTSIFFVVGIGGYVAADHMLQSSDLIGDKGLLAAASSALGKFPAFVNQKDLDEVKVLILEGDYDLDYGSNSFGLQLEGFKLTIGGPEALAYLKAEDQSAYDDDAVGGYFKSATSEIPINDYSDFAKFSNVEYIAINQPNATLYYYFGIPSAYLSKFNDLSVLENMKSLSDVVIFNAAATDFAPLGGLLAIENLSVQYCAIEDASVLGSLTGLKSLNLTTAGVSDISFVSSLTDLAELYLPGNQISDIGALKELKNLTDLFLNSNEIEDISPIRNLSQLKNLSLPNNQIKDISALSGLAPENLYLSANQIEDASPVFSASLKYLDIGENAIAGLGGIEKCALLETLYANGNHISDLSPLSGLESLMTLHADDNDIEDLSPLGALTSLANLSLKSNRISDISALAPLSGLSSISLDENQITDFSPIDAIAEEGGASVTGRDNQLVDYDDHEDEEDYAGEGQPEEEQD